MKPDTDVPLAETALDPSDAWVEIFHSLGLPAYRVRVETKDKMVCIQAPAEDFPRLLAPSIRPVLVKHGKSLGYRFVTLDMGLGKQEAEAKSP